MRLLLSVLAIVFVGVSASASDSASKKAQVLSEETVQMANGHYILKSVCIASSDYSEMKAYEFCMDSAHIINLLSNDGAMFSSSCSPDRYPSVCTDFNAYVLRTRMSVY